jgi:hypothetical protein
MVELLNSLLQRAHRTLRQLLGGHKLGSKKLGSDKLVGHNRSDATSSSEQVRLKPQTPAPASVSISMSNRFGPGTINNSIVHETSRTAERDDTHAANKTSIGSNGIESRVELLAQTSHQPRTYLAVQLKSVAILNRPKRSLSAKSASRRSKIVPSPALPQTVAKRYSAISVMRQKPDRTATTVKRSAAKRHVWLSPPLVNVAPSATTILQFKPRSSSETQRSAQSKTSRKAA